MDFCSAATTSAIGMDGSTSTTAGNVLMNRPTIDAASSRSAGRPDTVSPKVTTRSPVTRDNNTAHANCRTVASVEPCARATDSSPATSCESTTIMWLRGNE
ncbi:Uncharacterised protein [Mycobacteroides abscessus subsp. abscessus]|nr:Uncharacterised protein [Mycobacteroides abscessus subsp. abscessus]